MQNVKTSPYVNAVMLSGFASRTTGPRYGRQYVWSISSGVCYSFWRQTS